MSTETKATTLDDLVGEHLLSGVDFTAVRVKEWGDHYTDANACRFRLDGTTYVAVEDEDDGYRSHLRDLLVTDERLTNEWEPVRVIGSMATRGKYGGKDDVLELRDVKTGGIVLRVGTEDTNDYYPSFISEFTPEALAHNAARGEGSTK